VVVNAQGVKDNLKYTITFFLNQEHYNVERGLYSTAQLKGLVPRAHVYDEATPLMGPDGSALPRTIVLERGETVAEWVVRRAPDASVKAEVSHASALLISIPCHISRYTLETSKASNRVQNRYIVHELEAVGMHGIAWQGAAESSEPGPS
jgi:hypothetical protein